MFSIHKCALWHIALYFGDHFRTHLPHLANSFTTCLHFITFCDLFVMNLLTTFRQFSLLVCITFSTYANYFSIPWHFWLPFCTSPVSPLVATFYHQCICFYFVILFATFRDFHNFSTYMARIQPFLFPLFPRCYVYYYIPLWNCHTSSWDAIVPYNRLLHACLLHARLLHGCDVTHISSIGRSATLCRAGFDV